MSFSELASLPPSEPRKAALLLHAMAPADRAWLLGQMPVGEQETLKGLLSELSQMELPPDPELLRSALSVDASQEAGSHAHSHVAMRSDGDFLAELRAEDVDALVAAWRAQPATLVARALCLRSWAWRSAVLERLPALQRRRVMDRMESISREPLRANAFDAALMTLMRRSCEQAREQRAQHRGQRSSTDAGVSRWQLLQNRLKRLGSPL